MSGNHVFGSPTKVIPFSTLRLFHSVFCVARTNKLNIFIRPASITNQVTYPGDGNVLICRIRATNLKRSVVVV